MSDSDIFAELKLVLKCLVRGSAFARMRLPELTKQYEKQEGERLYVVAGRYGYENVSELINSFPEFKVTGNGLQTIVQLASKADLNKDVNKRSRYEKKACWMLAHDWMFVDVVMILI